MPSAAVMMTSLLVVFLSDTDLKILISVSIKNFKWLLYAFQDSSPLVKPSFQLFVKLAGSMSTNYSMLCNISLQRFYT